MQGDMSLQPPRYPFPERRSEWKRGLSLPDTDVEWPEQLRRAQEVIDMLDATTAPPPSRGLIADGLEWLMPDKMAAAIDRAARQLTEILIRWGCDINTSAYDRGGKAPPPLYYRHPGPLACHIVATFILILHPVDMVVEDTTEARKDARRGIFSRVRHSVMVGTFGPGSNAMFRLGQILGL